ncbi:MAG: helix-hairpin-helix domain-containing protein, partial [Candidatus Obscuribacterales bacterium]|nr:helix-hairpin-helix domain-containing protein [Candidatus Obscuribacterales bacterium]
LQDLNLDPSMADPRSQVPDQVEYSPEHQAISSEQVGQLNQVRAKLEEMLGNKRYPKDALTVVDCMFGLGLTEKSQEGIEMTMRECCEALALKGDTQARQIARCQVLLDKGLDLVREMIRTDMPGVAQAWQSDVNINSASRRELNHNLGLTEGEVDRLLSSRQYYSLDELIDKKVIKPERLPEIVEKGAVAAFVPVDLNNATRRDIIDICGADKTVSKKIVDMRPFASLDELLTKKILDPKTLGLLVEKGAVLKKQEAGPIRININKAEAEELQKLGLTDAQAQRLSRARPFGTWDELETFLCVDDNTWKAIRENACLSNNPT